MAEVLAERKRVLSLSDIRDVRSLSEFSGTGEATGETDLNEKHQTESDLLSPPLRTETAANSLYRWAEASQTLIFLDWDDTLFPTTEIFDNWGVSSDYSTWSTLELSAEQNNLLERWRIALQLYIKTACSLSERCVILTNARRPWVTQCLERFAPDLQPMLSRDDGPRIVYAREALPSQRGDPGSSRGVPARYTDKDILAEEFQEMLTKAKYAAMRQEAKDFYSQYAEQTWKNILSVGDSKYEHDAAQDLAFRRRAPARESLRVKAIVTPLSPTIRDLAYRLRLATLLWPAYVNFDGDLDLNMNTPEQLYAIADSLCMPELRGLVRPLPISEEVEESLVDDFDEVALLVHDRIME
jgi:hypothetical protein